MCYSCFQTDKYEILGIHLFKTYQLTVKRKLLLYFRQLNEKREGTHAKIRIVHTLTIERSHCYGRYRATPIHPFINLPLFLLWLCYMYMTFFSEMIPSYKTIFSAVSQSVDLVRSINFWTRTIQTAR